MRDNTGVGGMAQQEWQEIDQEIESLYGKLDVLRYVNPQEGSDAYTVDSGMPSFTYESFDHDHGTIDDALDDVEVQLPDTTVGGLYQDTVDKLRDLHTIIKYRGDDREAVRNATQSAYGAPSPDDVAMAEAILEEPCDGRPEPAYSTADMYRELRTMLDDAGLTHWMVRPDEDQVIEETNQANQEIRMAPFDDTPVYTAGELHGYAHHEGSHAVRGEHGRRQPFGIFGLGVGNYDALDEGLAVLAEFTAAGNDTAHVQDRMQTFALRTLASDAVHNQNATFTETYKQLADCTDEETAWDVTVRAHRGGGYAKDHIYLQGLDWTTDRLATADDPDKEIRTLYAGKFGTDHVDTVKQLIEDGTLERPDRAPLPTAGAADVEHVIADM